MTNTYGPDITEDEAYDELCEKLGCVRHDITIVRSVRVAVQDPRDPGKTLTGSAKMLRQAVEQIVGMRGEEAG